jgi:hypothetical protein
VIVESLPCSIEVTEAIPGCQVAKAKQATGHALPNRTGKDVLVDGTGWQAMGVECSL